MNAKITLADAYDTLYQGLQVEGVRLAVVNTARGERLAYETICSYQKDKYLVYIDAQNGQEISILNIQDII